MVISMSLMNNIHILTILCFSFAIFSYSLFFKNTKIISNVMGTAFFIPFCITLSGFLFFDDLNLFKIIALSEITLLFFLILLSIGNPKDVQLDFYQLCAVVVPIIISLVVHNNRDSFFFDYKDMYFAFTAVALSVIFIILHRSDKDTHNLSKPTVYLTIAYVIGTFESLPWLTLVSLGLKFIFYFSIMQLIYKHIHDEFMKDVREAKKLRKDFKDEINKEVKKRLFYMEMSKEKISKISQTDELTKALNRRGIMSIIDSHIMSKKITTFSILLFDIDNFKNINDTMGHIVGDNCLKTLSNVAFSNIRDLDSLGRYGGDEFIIVLPDLDTDIAFKVAERFRSKISLTEDPHFTVSIGIATYPQDGSTPRDLIDYADDGLYISKEKGRNKVSKK